MFLLFNFQLGLSAHVNWLKEVKFFRVYANNTLTDYRRAVVCIRGYHIAVVGRCARKACIQSTG